jgi:hypothetical protein
MVLCDFDLKTIQDRTCPVHTRLVQCILDQASPVITGLVR